MAKQNWLAKSISMVLCCYVPHDDDTQSQPAALQMLRPNSALSATLPTTTIPHGTSAGDVVSDSQALQQIFSSSSSVRGYQAASSSSQMNPDRSRSFDKDYKIGNQSLVKKSSGRLEQLGHHIRQRLSENRLSKSSSVATIEKDTRGTKHIVLEAQRKPDEGALLLGVNHQSTGMSDILMSRTASEGGYDSDAKSIQTALLKSNPGTIRVSPGLVRTTLREAGGDSLEVIEPPTCSDTLPLETQLNDPNSVSRKRSYSLPTPVTPSKTLFSIALQPAEDESPSDVLRRINIGIANGTVRLPSTPELRAMRMTNISDTKDDWQLPLSVSRSASNLDKSLSFAQDMLQALHERVEKSKRDSFMSNNRSEKCTSLISNIDPTLLQYISKFGDANLTNQAEHSFSNYFDTSARNSTASVLLPEQITQQTGTKSFDSTTSVPQQGKPTSDVQSLPDSDSESVHLCNMRISQRLASNSLVRVLSPNLSNIGSEIPPSATSSTEAIHSGPISLSRFPSWIAQEHNRRPSDPQTRRLFENNGNGQANMHPKWQTVTSVGSSSPVAKQEEATRDNGSSFYRSESGLPTSGAPSSVDVTRKSSIRNPNSFAVGGRSASGGLPLRYGSLGQLSNAEESAWLKGRTSNPGDGSEDSGKLNMNFQFPGRNRSASMPKESRFREAIGTPTPKAKRLRGETEKNETMSQISLNALRHGRNGSERMVSTGAAIDWRNENLSEVDPYTLHGVLSTVRHTSGRTSDGCLTQGKRSGWGFGLVNKSPRPRNVQEKQSSDISAVASRAASISSHYMVEESATNMWERALKRAQDDPHDIMEDSYSGFLRVPKYNRQGRPRSSNVGSSASSFSEQRGRSPSSLTPATRRSKSENGDEFSLERHQRLCFVARAPLSQARSTTGEQSTRMIKATSKEKPRKKSILDLKKFITTGIVTRDQKTPKPATGTATPVKDLFISTWTRFPSHTREERNGSAGKQDDVGTHDFERGDNSDGVKDIPKEPLGLTLAPASRSTVTLGLHTPGSLRLLSMRAKSLRRKSKSKIFRDKDGKVTTGFSRTLPRRRRAGFMRKINRLYRSSSSELRNYALGYGHRSSVSMGRQPKFPELEIIPGEGLREIVWDEQRAQREVKSDETTIKSDETMVKRDLGFGTKLNETWLRARKSRDWIEFAASSGSESAEASGENSQGQTGKEHRLDVRKPSIRDSGVTVGGDEDVFYTADEADESSPIKQIFNDRVWENSGDGHSPEISKEIQLRLVESRSKSRDSTTDLGKAVEKQVQQVNTTSAKNNETFKEGERHPTKNGDREDGEQPLEMPPKINDCMLRMSLEKAGSCEDVSGWRGGVDGA